MRGVGIDGRRAGRWGLAGVMLGAAMLACSAPTLQFQPTEAPGAPETALASALAGAFTQTAEAFTLTALAAPPTATATITLTPEPTASPTATLTPTPEGAFAQLSNDTHCRTGPLVVFELIDTVLTGQQVIILGKNPAGDYWYVAAPNGRDCWMWGRYAQVSGDTSQIPVFTPPPTPTPSFVWAGGWSVMIEGSSGTMTLTQSGSSVGGSLIIGMASYTMSGSTSAGGRDVSGDVLNSTEDVVAKYDFHMLDNTEQFRGSYTGGVWCGARGGAAIPSPCGWP